MKSLLDSARGAARAALRAAGLPDGAFVRRAEGAGALLVTNAPEVAGRRAGWLKGAGQVERMGCLERAEGFERAVLPAESALFGARRALEEVGMSCREAPDQAARLWLIDLTDAGYDALRGWLKAARSAIPKDVADAALSPPLLTDAWLNVYRLYELLAAQRGNGEDAGFSACCDSQASARRDIAPNTSAHCGDVEDASLLCALLKAADAGGTAFDRCCADLLADCSAALRKGVVSAPAAADLLFLSLCERAGTRPPDLCEEVLPCWCDIMGIPCSC